MQLSGTHRYLHRSRFSLIELLVAIAILALALTSALSLIGNAQRNLVVARDGWLDQHAVEQAVEFFLLTNPKSLNMPGGIMPEGYDASCTIQTALDTMPDFASQPRQGWVICIYDISVTHLERGEIDHRSIWQLVREEAAQ